MSTSLGFFTLIACIRAEYGHPSQPAASLRPWLLTHTSPIIPPRWPQQGTLLISAHHSSSPLTEVRQAQRMPEHSRPTLLWLQTTRGGHGAPRTPWLVLSATSASLPGCPRSRQLQDPTVCTHFSSYHAIKATLVQSVPELPANTNHSEVSGHTQFLHGMTVHKVITSSLGK